MFPLPSILSLYPNPRCHFFGLVSQSRRVTLLTSSNSKSCTMLNHSDVNMSHLPRMLHIAKPLACFGCSMSRLCMESRHVEFAVKTNSVAHMFCLQCTVSFVTNLSGSVGQCHTTTRVLKRYMQFFSVSY